MTILAKEAARMVDDLPFEKAKAVVEYARYLAEKAEDEAWERRFTAAKHTNKFKAFLKTVDRQIAGGKAKLLDLRRL